MSSEAVTELGGIKRTAWAYRSEYLSDQIFHEYFYCPYCDIPLIAKNVNTDGEIIHAPHFSHKPGRPHVGDCDGEAIYGDKAESTTKKRELTPKIIEYPEELVIRPTRRVAAASAVDTAIKKALTPEEIFKRRIASGIRGKAKPTSYLLQPFVETYVYILKEAYSKFPKKEQAMERKEWVKSTLSSMSLKLDDLTNYQQAFKSPAYPDSKRRIYNGIGQVSFSNSMFKIAGKCYSNFQKVELSFGVFIDNHLLIDGAPRAHLHLVSQLTSYAHTNEVVKFYCYGLCKATDLGDMVISLNNLDYLYVKKHYPSQGR